MRLLGPMAIATTSLLLPLGAHPASATDFVDSGTSPSGEITCPKGTIKVTHDDGSVTCAKIRVVDPSTPGF